MTVLLVLRYEAFGRVSTYRYRLNVEVNTPDGVKFGSSVVEISWWTNYWIPGLGPRDDDEITGDATFVDLGHGKNIVALLAAGPTGEERHFDELTWRAFGHKEAQEGWIAMETERGSVELRSDEWPTFITFRNVAVPDSAEVIIRPDDLGAVVGEGYSLKRVWIESTSDPIASSLDEKLPWLKELIARAQKTSKDIRIGGFYLWQFRRSGF